MALGRIDAELTAAEAQYTAALVEFQELEIVRIGRMIAGGLDIANLIGGDSSGLFNFRRPLRGKLLNLMTRVKNFGIGQVADETKRQGVEPSAPMRT